MPTMALLAAGLLMTSACGGGGGVASTPAPPAPTPTPTNTVITDLKATQTFASESATTQTTLNTSTGLVERGAAARSAVTVRYDAATQSYTITGDGRAQTFLPADERTGQDPGQRLFVKTGDARDFLTIVTTPFTGTVANRYVALGFWQRNAGTAPLQETSLDVFTFGLDTPVAAVPRTGTAQYATDAFGFVTQRGVAPRAFTGAGSFAIDLALGTFALKNYVQEYDLTTEESRTGGGIEVVAAGRLGSGNGFTGNVTYGGRDTRVAGTIAGRFYGPGAEELGASFAADDGAGGAVTGSITGQRQAGAAQTNLSLTNLTVDQLYYSQNAQLTVGNGFMGARAVNTYVGNGQVQQRPDGSFSVLAATSALPSVTGDQSNRVTDARPNFVTYTKTVDGAPTRVSFYRPGAANSELALTYAGFGVLEALAPSATYYSAGRNYFAYGLTTPTYVLTRRTGSAEYAGVAYGYGARPNGQDVEVTGTSRFTVDFGNQRYSGSLALEGAPVAGGAAQSLGSWTFANQLFSGQMAEASLSPTGTPTTNFFNRIVPQLYGPDGEEIAAAFSVAIGADGAADRLSIVGATVAKRK
ncbi:hypothetical protein [Sphingomonas sp. 1P08PE]|uniref:hypothetical protein n=1 Tax=Sphingomonas sp. 1P08PE TaxID=554122 RepID=UPI0039A09336